VDEAKRHSCRKFSTGFAKDAIKSVDRIVRGQVMAAKQKAPVSMGALINASIASFDIMVKY
jgi:hypothetical protein